MIGWPLGLPWMAGAGACATVAALMLALLVDHLFGEPPVRWHPVVWIGTYLGWAGRRIAPAAGTSTTRRADVATFAAGTLAWCVGAALVIGAAVVLQAALWRLPLWVSAPLTGLLLKPLLAWRMLRTEVMAVEAALGVSLEAGRAQLARLVSRDVSALSEAEVRESAIESLAENFNDSVMAPLFWFVLLGLPGAALYRFANTADAMWGYRGPRGGREWEWAGKWAARADDVLSWLPARLSASLLLCVGRAWPRRNRGAARCTSRSALRREARRTPSPNSGWPMAAMALLLGVRLGKPGVYTLNETGRPPAAPDTVRAVRLGWHALFGLVMCASAATAAMAWLSTTLPR